MAVPAYTPPTKSISLPRTTETLTVRGLSLEDITSLLHAHLPDITLAVEQYRASLSDVYSTRSMDAFLASMMTGFPKLAAAVIATAADDPEAVDQIRRYPSGVQIKALVAIAELSLEDMGDLSDPSPALANLVRQVMSGPLRRETQSLGGSGPTAAPSAGS